MDQQDQPSSGTRKKQKFKPRAPPPRTPIPSFPKSEVVADDGAQEAAQAEKLLKKFNANLRRQVPKVEKQSPVQVAFGFGAESSTSIRKYGIPKKDNTGRSCIGSGMENSDDDDGGKFMVLSPSTSKQDGMCPPNSTDSLPSKVKKDYREPWDYHHSYYPTSLPLRRPYSGDPEILNEIEFGDAAEKSETTNESTMNPASSLGLLEESDNEKMFLFQLPAKLPLVNRSASAKGKEKAESSAPLESRRGSERCTSLGELPQGYVGKMLVYKSGAVKLKLGDVLCDVSPGTDHIFAEDAMAINTSAKHCCNIGEIGKHAVITPNVESLLDSLIKLD